MTILGPNLEQLFDFCEKQFSLKTVLSVGMQLIERLRWMHSRNFVHRDMKPENILIGQGKKATQVYLIDFGLSKRFINPATGQHVQNRQAGVVGTLKFLSKATHEGWEHARRDDMEALGIIMVYFLKGGKVPWNTLPKPNRDAHEGKKVGGAINLQTQMQQEREQKRYLERIKQVKIQTSVEDLCSGLPVQFVHFLNHCRGLEFQESPNYDYLKQLLEDLFRHMRYEDDAQYSWVDKRTEIEEKRRQEEEELRRIEEMKA